jgi:hypothetical protein
MPLVSLLYPLVIIIYLLIGVAIVFHMLRYKINQRVAFVMFVIYIAGSLILLVSNFSLFSAVNWNQIFSAVSF